MKGLHASVWQKSYLGKIWLDGAHAKKYFFESLSVNTGKYFRDQF
jgi:hypothetical protein